MATQNYARVVADQAVETFMLPDGADIALYFHPDIVRQFVEVPQKVRAGWQKGANGWIAPLAETPVTPPAVSDLRITRLAFLNRFTQAERIAVRTAARDAPVMADWLSMVDAATWVDLGNADTITGIETLAAVKLITADRAVAILSATVQDSERP